MKRFITRRDIIVEAIEKCLAEMYKYAQPPVTNLKEALENFSKEPKELQRKYPFYSRYYISQEEHNEFIEMYLNAYNIINPFKDHMDTLREYLEKGGSKDKYIEAYTDEYGYHPGYRGYEKVPPIAVHIEKLIMDHPSMKDNIMDEIIDMRDKVIEKVFELITECKNFYNANRYECAFRMDVGNISPTSNKDTVIEYWKTQGVDLEIKDRVYDEDEDEWVYEDEKKEL